MTIRKSALMLGACALLGIPAFASADMHWDFTNVVTGDDPGFEGVFATLDCMQMGDDAMFTLSFSGDVQDGAFLSQLDLNYDGDTSGLGFDDNGNDGVLGASFGSFVDAGSEYDIRVDFSTAGGPDNDRIGPGDSVTFTITGADCDAFNVLSVPQGQDAVGQFALLHIQGVGQDNLGSIKVAPVPEPASMAALGMGALGLLARRRRARK